MACSSSSLSGIGTESDVAISTATESTTSSTETESAASLLLDRLRAPEMSELNRKRKLQLNGLSKGKRC